MGGPFNLYVQGNQTRYESSIVVTDNSVETWNAREAKFLDATSFARNAELKPELILIGSGRVFRFPPPASLRPLVEARIGHEVIDTRAACRTYNALQGEGRNVLAALIVG